MATLIACSTSKKSVQYDYSYLYQEDQKLIKPRFKLFHRDQDTSVLYFKIKSDDILYGKLGGDSLSIARVLCKYKVYGKKGKKDIVDSATVPLISYGENAAGLILQAKVKMAIPQGELYPMEIRFRDEYRDLNVVYYHWADKRPNGNSQYYLIKQGQKIIEDHIVAKGNRYSLHKSKLITANRFSLKQSGLEYEMTPPPFATEVEPPYPPTSDSSISKIFVSDSLIIEGFERNNWLVCDTDSSLRPFYFFRFQANFPEVTQFEKMIGPIRYISTSSEYKSLQHAINKKKALDHFWLELGKQEERTKKMIREFYRRVELANRYFSNFREGWKTDRGIIMIVYGEPSSIYKSINQEKWVYGEENHILSIQFNFQLRDNNMSRNVFELERNSDYKNNWYRAVDSWRQAKIY
ncbi:MAG: GWxTD domain-containing protein [Vicingaceae bacterium]